MTNSHPFPKVLIEWEDSSHFEAGWKWGDELPDPHPLRCVTCGFLVKEGERSYIVALSIGDANSERPQFNGIMEIPKSCVLRFTSFCSGETPQIFQQERDRPMNFLCAMRQRLGSLLSLSVA